MAILAVLIAAILFAILIFTSRRSKNVSLQRATVEVPVITVESEAEFEEQLQILLNDLSPIALYYLEQREEYFIVREQELEDAYRTYKEELIQLLRDLYDCLPLRMRHLPQCQRMMKALRSAIATNEPLRFFKVVQRRGDEFYFVTLYNTLVELDCEAKRRDLLHRVSVAYSELCNTIQLQNALNCDKESYATFVEANEALIEAMI